MLKTIDVSSIILFLFVTAGVSHFVHSAAFVSAGDFSSENSMRCNKKLVSVGDSKAKVFVVCGKPLFEDTVTANGNMGEVVVQWTYSFGSGTFFRILSFKDGKLISIHQGDRVP